MLQLLLWAAMLCSGQDTAAQTDRIRGPAPTDVTQFDAILELNAPILRSHVVLFARYWVASAFYRIAVLWAEPHALNLNFPMYPVTMTIDSNEQGFSVTNQVQAKLGQTFHKPVGQRDIFRHRLNSYPIGEMRFTETEALASRLYRSDIDGFPWWTANGAQGVELGGNRNRADVKREAASLNLRMSRDRVDAVQIVDANGLLIKSIGYEYTPCQGRSFLCRENVLLPERPLLLDYGQRGVNIRVNSTERTFKQLCGLDHEGGRRCSVEFKPPEASNDARPMPVRVVVQRADTGAVLRSARMFNFARKKMTPDEVREAARHVGQFSQEELTVRSLFAKYWSADPNKITSEDAQALSHLRAHFETSGAHETAGERLRRTHMLMQLDWLQGTELIDHYHQYLGLLTAQGFHTAAFLGGLNVIDTAAQRRQYSTADALLREWADHVTATMETPALLILGRSQARKGHFWAIARLLRDSARSAQRWGPRQFDAEAVRCLALHSMLEAVRDPPKKTRTAGAQIAWASRSLDLGDLPSLANECLADARRLYKELAQADSTQRTLKNELDRIDRDTRRNESGDFGQNHALENRGQNNEIAK